LTASSRILQRTGSGLPSGGAPRGYAGAEQLLARLDSSGAHPCDVSVRLNHRLHDAAPYISERSGSLASIPKRQIGSARA